MSDWIPHHHEIADEIAVLRSCVSDGLNHSGGRVPDEYGVDAGGAAFAWGVGDVWAGD